MHWLPIRETWIYFYNVCKINLVKVVKSQLMCDLHFLKYFMTWNPLSLFVSHIKGGKGLLGMRLSSRPLCLALGWKPSSSLKKTLTLPLVTAITNLHLSPQTRWCNRHSSDFDNFRYVFWLSPSNHMLCLRTLNHMLPIHRISQEGSIV